MATHRVLKGVLRGFLGTYTSRYSHYDGYWLFGFLVRDLSTTRIDLLDESGGAGDDDTPSGVARRLAASEFRDQLAKHGLSLARVASAELVLARGGAERALVDLDERDGFQVHFRVSAQASTGQRFAAEETLFVAPHDPALERQSARR